jgi:hypothetical protein
MSGIPRRIHFCFGLSPDFAGMPWGLVHFACVRSAVLRIKPQYASLYYEYEPSGPWWDLTKSLIDVEKIVAPRRIFDRPLMHPAHRADVVRLEKLLKHGGIYLDCDVLVVNDFQPLLMADCVLGAEGVGGGIGLCNAVILATENAPFIRRWLERYKSFRSTGHDTFWNEHSVQLPKQLAADFPNELTVLDHKAFFWPTWEHEHVKWMFASTRDLNAPNAFAHHLWETRSYAEYLDNLTIERVRRVDTNFHRLVRPLIATLPYDFAAPSWRSASAIKLRKVVTKGGRLTKLVLRKLD